MFKSKKFWIIFSIIFILIISLVIFLCLYNKETKELRENTYKSYLISNNDTLLEIEFKESYYECNKRGKTRICSDINREIINVKVLNDLDITLDNLDLENTIIKFVNALVDSDKDIQDLIINSNYKFNDEFKENLKNNINDINIKFNYQENIEEFDIEEKYYTITFDTDGGSSIDSIVVKNNGLITKPNDPVKDGYIFKGWFVDDKEYDFSKEVNNDITLVAKWEKKKDSGSSTGSTSSGNSSKINLNSNLSATVYKKSTGTQNCFFYLFADNLKELYPDAEFSAISNGTIGVGLCPFPKSDCSSSEIALEDLNNNSNIVYNTNKEKFLEKNLKTFDNTPGFNLISFNNDNHKISFEYEYITFNGLDVSDGTNANKKIESILKGSYLFQGPCGGFDFLENITVNEEVCDRFNLDCGRW